MQTLKERQSLREFSPASIPRQVLSDLLWAAYGINRPENGHRTAPSAMNSQEIDIYVVLAEGTFLYDARTRCLQPVKIGDLRRKTGGQEFVTVAPLALVYIADLDKLQKAKPEVKERYAAIDTGSIIQNVYLYCASEDLATVVHELDAQAFHESLKLKPSQKIVIAQSVGYAKSPPKSPPPPK